MTELRPPVEADWDAVLAAADAAGPLRPGDQPRQWICATGAPSTRPDGVRRHHVAVAEDGRVIGYGAVELATAGATRARLFVTTAPALLPSVGDALYRRLIADAEELGVATVWLRELTGRDEPLLAFLRARGFVETRASQESLETANPRARRKASSSQSRPVVSRSHTVATPSSSASAIRRR